MRRFYYDNTASDTAVQDTVKFTAPPGMGFSKFTIGADYPVMVFLSAESIAKNEFMPIAANVPLTFDFSGDVYSIPEIFVTTGKSAPTNVGMLVLEYGSKPNVNAFLSEE